MESIDTLNQRLLDHYGTFELGDKPNFKLSWGPDQTEIQLGTFRDFIPGTDIFIREVKEFREVKKYPFNRDKWVLERCVPNTSTTLQSKVSYEPIWVFGMRGDPYGLPIEPKWLAIEFIISNLLKGEHRKSVFAKYVPSEKDGNDAIGMKLRVDELMEALYGEQSRVGDALMSKNAVALSNRDAEIKQ